MYDINEDNWSYYEPPKPDDYTIKHCPVCKTIFKILKKQKPLMAYCDECNTDYYFHSNRIKPYKNDPHFKKRCGCGACQERDS